MKGRLFGLLIACGLSMYTQAYEAPTGWATVTKVTAALDVVRFEIQGATLCGTSVFRIETTTAGGRDEYSALLTAASSGKKIWVETWEACPSSNPAQNWGMKVGALTIQYF